MDFSNKIFYHGSNNKFTIFDKSKIKENKLGLCFNFTDDYNKAYEYGDNILKVKLDLNNPITEETLKSKWTFEQDNMLAKKLGFPDIKEEDFDNTETFGDIYNIFKMDPRFIEVLEEMGYDGISFPEDNHFGVFEPEQIHVIQNEQLGYHGTKVNFDKFDLNKIKDWRYGYGIYFTRSKGYAQNYGNVKEYDLPENEYLLSWEDSLDYQPETIQEALFRIWKDTKEQDKNKEIEKAIFGDFANDGEAIYYAISKALNLSGKRTSEFLNKYGIKGIDSFKGNCIVIFNPEDIKLIKNIKESIMDLTKNCFSDNFDKYTDDELADQIPVDIDYENGMYILHSDLFEIENENLETAIEECIEEHSNFGEIRDSLEFDDFDDVIWEYIAPTEELPYGRLIFTYHQTFDSQWRPSGWRPEDDDLSDWEFQDDFDENFKSLNEKLEKFI